MSQWRQPTRSGGINDATLVGTIAALFGSCGAFWLASGIGGLLTHGRWPDIRFVSAAPGVRRLFTDPGDPMGAWPARIQPQLPSPALFYAVFTTLVVLLIGVVFGVAAVRVRRRSRPR